MFGKRKQNQRDDHTQEKYRFIREQVRPQKRKQAMHLAKCFAGVAASACVFGVIAGGIILLMYDAKKENTSEKAVITEFSPAPKETSEPTVKNEEKEYRLNYSVRNYNRITQKLADVGEKFNKSLVGIKGKGSIQSWLYNDITSGNKIEYGMLFQESEAFYYIVTTNSITQEQDKVEVQLQDETIVDGKVLGTDSQLDVALISIQKKDIAQKTKEQMQVAKLGTKDAVQCGTNVIAVGCPNGVYGSVLVGRVTNDSLKGGIMDGELELMGLDMPYSEKSTGVVLDSDGYVLGLLTGQFTEETGTGGLAFAEISSIYYLLDYMKMKKSIPFVGIEGKTVTEEMAKLHNTKEGAYVTAVYAGTPAYTAGMRVADIVTELAGEPIKSMTQFHEILASHNEGDKVKCLLYRKAGKKMVRKKLSVVLG